MSSSPSKKSKTDDCVTKEDSTIPVNTVTRMIAFKVAGEVS